VSHCSCDPDTTSACPFTLSRRDKKEMKSAHSLTLSNDCRHLSTWPANFLYLASDASSDAVAAAMSSRFRVVNSPLPDRQRCSGVVRPLVGATSSAYAVRGVSACDADDPLRDRPGIMSLDNRPCEAGRRRGREGSGEGEAARDVGVDVDGPASGALILGGTAAILNGPRALPGCYEVLRRW